MTSPAKRFSTRTLILSAILAVGAWLRLWRLGSQIPFDDEWHAISYVVDHDLGYLLTHFTRLGANSVPHNLYLRLAHQTIGLSEWSIAFPSLLCGLLLLWFFPRWVWERCGASAGVVSGVMLALSPFLIFYSRFARPYAPLLLVEFLAVTSLLGWAATGRKRQRALAVGFGALAMWIHVTAIPPLFAAWTAACLLQRRAHRRQASAGPSPGKLLTAGLVMLAAAFLLMLPSLLRAGNPSPDATEPFTLHTADALSQLLLGSSQLGPRLLLASATSFGLWLAARKLPAELAVLGAAALAAVVTVLVAHPNQSEIGAIFARYALPIFWLPALALGVAAQWFAGRIPATGLWRWTAAAAGLGLTLALCLAGPLPYVYVEPASFTKHPAFQYEYPDFDAAASLPDPVMDKYPRLARAELHPFYARVARAGGQAPIIEYPFLIGENVNRLYLAQMLHRRPVLAGYYASGTTRFDLFGLALGEPLDRRSREALPGYMMGEMTVDQALGHLVSRAKIRFRTVIDIADLDALRGSGAEYLVLHWNPAREFLFLEVDSRLGASRGRYVADIRDRLRAELGRPIVDDERITVFALRWSTPPARRF
jgi:hypothetical protein